MKNWKEKLKKIYRISFLFLFFILKTNKTWNKITQKFHSVGCFLTFILLLFLLFSFFDSDQCFFAFIFLYYSVLLVLLLFKTLLMANIQKNLFYISAHTSAVLCMLCSSIVFKYFTFWKHFAFFIHIWFFIYFLGGWPKIYFSFSFYMSLTTVTVDRI